MNILGISGSPRKDGNAAYVVQYALQCLAKEGATTRYLSVAGKTIHPCIDCSKCGEARQCIFEDDIEEFINALRCCDGLISSSPVYFGSVSGQLKTLMDRSLPLRTGGAFELSGKLGAGIACAGFRNGGLELTLQCMHAFMLIHNMLVIGDGPGSGHLGATIVGQAQKDAVGLRTVRGLAHNMISMIEHRRDI